MHGSHFRRQMPIGNFIVNFACSAARLVIEVDGSQHGEENTVSLDGRRTEWLKSEGYRVLRFWNSDVLQNIDAVMESIYAELFGSPAAAPRILKHQRRRKFARPVTPPRPPSR
jgi:very-short-patch-repair endonuclease